jgi:hypothetical protein
MTIYDDGLNVKEVVSIRGILGEQFVSRCSYISLDDMTTTDVSRIGSTAHLVDLALAAVCRPEADVWGAIARLADQTDAGRHLNRRYRAAQSPVLRWALVFVAANLGNRDAVPLLIEASVGTGDDDVDISAARIATEALVRLVDF